MNSFLNEVIKLNEYLNMKTDLDEILGHVFISFKRFLPCCYIGISLLNDMSECRTKQAYIYQDNHFRRSVLENLLKDVMRKTQLSNSYLVFSDNDVFRSNIAYPLSVNGHMLGVILFSHRNNNVYTARHISYIRLIAENIAINLDKKTLLDDLVLSSIIGFTHLVEAKDSNTGQHISRIQLYSRAIAEDLYHTGMYGSILHPEYIEDIYKFSALHDIGKVGIPDSILLKPARLNPSEFDVMKTHTTIGADVLRKASSKLMSHGKNFFEMGIRIAESHHEKYDGSGYPNGLSGGSIPLCARIVTVADVFDALSSKRVYKNAWDLDKSFDFIKKESRSSFDPNVVQSFFNSREQIISIYENYNEYAENAVNMI